jgi:N-hydroxyarylamine O-acetyltransferase
MVNFVNAAHTTVDAYCQRINYHGSRIPTLATLQALVKQHTSAIAFENLDSFSGETVATDLPAITHKLLEQGRGGYCFEHNTLLWHVLQELGFKVSGLASRVRWNVPDEIVTPIGHMMLKVMIDDVPWLVDAGFGGLTVTAALQLDSDATQATPHEDFRITQQGTNRTLCVWLNDHWKPLYEFDDREFLLPDYAVWNWFTCTSPVSPFTSNLMCARPVTDGRHALINNCYTWRGKDGQTVTRQLQSADELVDVLKTAFALRAPTSDKLITRLAGIAASPAR